MKKITPCSDCSNTESCTIKNNSNVDAEEYVKNIKVLKRQIDCIRVIQQKEEIKRKELLEEILL
jgi:hypothetical protein